MRRPGASVGAIVVLVMSISAFLGGCSSATDVSTSLPQQCD